MEKNYIIKCGKCYKEVLYFDRKFIAGETIYAERFRLYDDSEVNNGESFICPFCQYKPSVYEFEQLIIKAQYLSMPLNITYLKK